MEQTIESEGLLRDTMRKKRTQENAILNDSYGSTAEVSQYVADIMTQHTSMTETSKRSRSGATSAEILEFVGDVLSQSNLQISRDKDVKPNVTLVNTSYNVKQNQNENRWKG